MGFVKISSGEWINFKEKFISWKKILPNKSSFGYYKDILEHKIKKYPSIKQATM